ncbi:thiol reductant ABC exporter subunit CydD [Psychrobacter fulvigenes]|uniref:thiol reductant ABC exporter subunit CydD n=1 Tax=Psychrobacter fulvigenes TaxID=533323 RepID=UPI001919F75F|nr:thiol reductant ABC exporter subunit CydD [Psychrobacter fulvigenes]
MATLSNAEKRFLKALVTSVSRPLNLAWALTIISTLFFVWQAWLLANLFSTWLNNHFNELPLSTGVSNYWFVGLLLCFMIRPLLNSGRELISSRASLKVRSELRESLLSTMAKLGPNLRYFGSDGSLSSQIIDQTDALDGFISSFSVQRKVATSTPIILVIAVAWQSWIAAALLLLTAPLVPIFMILIGHLTARKSADQFTALAQLSGRFLDWVRGMPTLKRLQATDIAAHDLTISSEDYRRRTMDVLKVAFLNGAVLELLAALSIALVAVYLGFGLIGILPWAKGEVPVPYFGALFILLLAPEFYVPLRQLGADYHAKAQAEGAVQSLLPIIEAASIETASIENTKQVDSEPLDDPSSVKDNNDRKSNRYTADAMPLDVSQAFGIALSNLSIRSPIATSPELANQQTTDTAAFYRTRLAPVSFGITAGERVALIGDSGSGKSSLLQALMGFVNYEGCIELISKEGGQRVELTDINPESLRQNIGYLAQQVALMPLTIAQNLRLANPNATEQALIDALEVVELWELIKRLPDGIHTQLGERGQGLSGGQQQRLGIAQLLLRDDSLWLLDEPTEHLDPDTAQRIHALLERVSRHKTVIWITHAHEQLDWLDNVIRLSLPMSQPLSSATNHQALNANTGIGADTNEHSSPLGDKP